MPSINAKNLQIADLPNVRFAHGSAEAIPANDNTFDIVILFKSLHHVPMGHMDQALCANCARCSNRAAWPGFPSQFLRWNSTKSCASFTTKQIVRRAAAAAVCRAVADGLLLLRKSDFQHAQPVRQFRTVRCASPRHPQQPLAPRAVPQVQEKFANHWRRPAPPSSIPQQVDLLQKPRRPDRQPAMPLCRGGPAAMRRCRQVPAICRDIALHQLWMGRTPFASRCFLCLAHHATPFTEYLIL